MGKDITKHAITACKQYCLAAGATQGNIACMQNVKKNGRMTSGNKTQSRSCPHIHKTRNSKKEEFKLC